MSTPRHGSRRPTAGFTLIELLAVVLILGLLAALVAPNVGFGSSRVLASEAEQLADALEYARQRAVMTGRPHRVWIDLDAASYGIEWQPRSEEGEPGGRFSSVGSSLISLSPPQHEVREFQPVPGAFGRTQALPESVALVSVEIGRKEIRRGSAVVRFEPDGSADPALIWLADLHGDETRVLRLRPLADAVRVERGES